MYQRVIYEDLLDIQSTLRSELSIKGKLIEEQMNQIEVATLSCSIIWNYVCKIASYLHTFIGMYILYVCTYV